MAWTVLWLIFLVYLRLEPAQEGTKYCALFAVHQLQQQQQQTTTTSEVRSEVYERNVKRIITSAFNSTSC